MEKIITDETVVKVGVKPDGHIIIDTKAPVLPTDVAQEILDEVICHVLKSNTNEDLRRMVTETKRECTTWKFVAIFATIMMFIMILKMKGVI